MTQKSAPNKLVTVTTSNYINMDNKKFFKNKTIFLYVTKQTRHILLLSTPTCKEWVKRGKLYT